MKKTPEEIASEIKTLETIKPFVLRESSFGDNHHDAIDGQLRALRENWSEDDVHDVGDDAEEGDLFGASNVKDAAIEAVQWASGDEEMAPSESWKPLVRQ